MSARSYGCFVVLLLAVSSACADQGDETQKLRVEALRQWEALEREASPREVIFTQRVPMGKDKLPAVIKGRYLVSGTSTLMHVREPSPPGGAPGEVESVIGKNERYVFLLKRKANATSFAVTYLGQNDADFERKIEKSVSRNGVNSPWSVVLGKPVREWLNEPGFTLQGMERVLGVSGMVRITGRYVPPEGTSDRRMNRSRELSILVEPDHRWRVSSYKTKTKISEFTVTTDYGPDGRDGLPVPRGSKRVTHDRSGIEETFQDTYDRWEYLRSAPPAEAFRLSAFGLPEPVSEPPKRQSLVWLWLTGGAGVFGAAAWWVRRRFAAA